jgi:hypothetical protein
MKTRVDTAYADNGATVEIATITHNGREFTNHGAVIDLDSGHVAAYITDDMYLDNARRVLTDWSGNRIGDVKIVSQWRQYASDGSPYTMRSVRARINGDNRQWFGRYGSDWSQLVHLRPCKATP